MWKCGFWKTHTGPFFFDKYVTCETYLNMLRDKLMPQIECLGRGVQPFAIPDRITFINMKYGRQWVRVVFMRYIKLKNGFYPVYVKLHIHSITLCESPSRLLRIVSTDFLALRLFCFNICQHGCQILNFKLHVDGRKACSRSAVGCALLA